MASDTNTSLASSLTDLMTSLMVIFVLLLVATLNNASAKGENTRSILLDQLKRQLSQFAQEGVRIEKDPKDPLGLLVLVPERFFNFEVSKSTIPKGGNQFLEQFAPTLAGITCSSEYKNEIGSIVVEGHTDSTGSDEFNLRLSQDRSMAVVQSTLDALARSTPQHKDCFLDFLSANGRGKREPMTNALGIEDKDRSRRVVFKIRVRASMQREIQEILR